jgi:hypothetical protein
MLNFSKSYFSRNRPALVTLSFSGKRIFYTKRTLAIGVLTLSLFGCFWQPVLLNSQPKHPASAEDTPFIVVNVGQGMGVISMSWPKSDIGFTKFAAQFGWKVEPVDTASIEIGRNSAPSRRGLVLDLSISLARHAVSDHEIFDFLKKSSIDLKDSHGQVRVCRPAEDQLEQLDNQRTGLPVIYYPQVKHEVGGQSEDVVVVTINVFQIRNCPRFS